MLRERMYTPNSQNHQESLGKYKELLRKTQSPQNYFYVLCKEVKNKQWNF